MKYNIENQARGIQDLIDEIEKEQDKITEKLRYTLTGVIGGRELSDQEYAVFVERALTNKSFSDIAFNLSINESSAKTYYKRAIDKLSACATRLKHKIK
tara:strand:- start:372 stop:668 length:297 start_codon:yes stop_codon:yes gene_type:complete